MFWTRWPPVIRFAWLAIAAAVITITLKTGAWLMTGSVGLLSDAMESVVNLVAAIVALITLHIARKDPDSEHAYGHTKAEYFSSGLEGALILVAAGSIVLTALPRLLDPEPLELVGWGLAVASAASVVNLVVSRILIRAAREHRSITLEADARHLMTDVVTSVGVLSGVLAVSFTGWHRLDPIVAIAVALNVLLSGVRLLRRSMLGLLDTSLPEETLTRIKTILDSHGGSGVRYHALRTRQAGARRFISFHILVPGEWTVQRGHDLLEEIEERIREAVPRSVVDTHLEPIEDPVSWADARLERPPQGGESG